MAEALAKDEVNNLTLEENIKDDINNITTVEPVDEWNQFRLDMAEGMFNIWQFS